MQKLLRTVDFKPISLSDRDRYEQALAYEVGRGCEFSFANLYLWGRQNIAFLGEQALLFSQFNRRTVYPFPVGEGDKRAALDRIIEDSHARGIPCRITGVLPKEQQLIEAIYPGKFRFHHDESSFDYVYDINDLAELKGKKYHGKKNHLNRFMEENKGYTVAPITEKNMQIVREFSNAWYEEKLAENPNGDFHMEKAALARAFRDFSEIGLFGLILFVGDKAVAFTMGSRLSADTVDVHFEKARSDINGAYTAINYEFARFVRDTIPAVKYLDREEDMGIEGLRRAKRSYKPHHMVEKCWACLLEEGYDY